MKYYKVKIARGVEENGGIKIKLETVKARRAFFLVHGAEYFAYFFFFDKTKNLFFINEASTGMSFTTGHKDELETIMQTTNVIRNEIRNGRLNSIIDENRKILRELGIRRHLNRRYRRRYFRSANYSEVWEKIQAMS